MKTSRFLILSLLFAANLAFAEMHEAEIKIKNSPCLGQTIEEVLKNKIHIRSQRDLGWQTFDEEGHVEVERAFLMNKSMQLRFRWRLNADGSITPVSKRAESLCTGEAE
ncbi:hypothetical protein [Methylomicrobium lacus]|uniref:hypothetical protein n=1 Tax=Methylomicrobium lacus TaxID=136992 RepID=UPI0035A99F11